jgi:hypothetical protein
MADNGITPPHYEFSEKYDIERDFAAGPKMIGHADFIRHWDKWCAYVLRVKK